MEYYNGYYEHIEPGFFAHHWQVFLDFRHLLWSNTLETLYLTFATVAISYAVGLPLGVFLKSFIKGGLSPSRPTYAALDFAVNTVRSIPFIILMVFLIPISRAIIGTGMGTEAAIFMLSIAAIPFVSRMVEAALSEVDVGVIDAAKSMGASKFQIITKVILPESVPSLIRGFPIVAITIMAFSALTGTIGAGGLGNLAISYGHQRNRQDVLLLIIIIIVAIAMLLQFLSNRLAAKIDKRLV